MITVDAIILAAGQSSRMGAQNKLLTPLAGRPLLHHALNTFCGHSGIREVILVTGHQSAQVQASTHGFDARVVHAQHHADGMSASLKCGVQALRTSCDAFFVALGDMPHVCPSTLEQLISTMDRHQSPIVAPSHQGRRGHPVLFARALAPQFLALTGDRGAKEILQQSDITLVDVNDPGILKDYDTPESFNSVLKVVEEPFE